MNTLEPITFDFEPTMDNIFENERIERKQIQKKYILDKGKKMYNIVCRHWAYGAGCMKGMACEFLHQHDHTKMPICIHFIKNKCSRGKECMFRHVREPCHAYKRGNCPRGTECTREHVQQDQFCVTDRTHEK